MTSSFRNLENRVVYDVIVKAQNKYGISQPSHLFNFYVNYKGNYDSISNSSYIMLMNPTCVIHINSLFRCSIFLANLP